MKNSLAADAEPQKCIELNNNIKNGIILKLSLPSNDSIGGHYPNF